MCGSQHIKSIRITKFSLPKLSLHRALFIGYPSFPVWWFHSLYWSIDYHKTCHVSTATTCPCNMLGLGEKSKIKTFQRVTYLSRVPHCMMVGQIHKFIHQIWLAKITCQRTKLLVSRKALAWKQTSKKKCAIIYISIPRVIKITWSKLVAHFKITLSLNS